VLDSYFKLKNKSYLIRRFRYDLIRFFHFVVAYFWGPPCIVTVLSSPAAVARRSCSFLQFNAAFKAKQKTAMIAATLLCFVALVALDSLLYSHLYSLKSTYLVVQNDFYS